MTLQGLGSYFRGNRCARALLHLPRKPPASCAPAAGLLRAVAFLLGGCGWSGALGSGGLGGAGVRPDGRAPFEAHVSPSSSCPGIACRCCHRPRRPELPRAQDPLPLGKARAQSRCGSRVPELRKCRWLSRPIKHALNTAFIIFAGRHNHGCS